MKLLVIGATGATGQEVVKQVLEAGHQVTALMRDAAKTRFPPPVRKATGDVLDADSLERALTGQRAGFISRADVAAFCLNKVTTGRYRQQMPVITN